MKGRAALLLLLSALVAMPALAGNVYRCDGGNGVTSYSNKRVAGASCKLVGSYKAQRKAKSRPSAPVAVAKAVPAKAESASAVAASTGFRQCEPQNGSW